MSVIQSIRDKGAWIMFGIIALALIAFILQDGLGRGRGGGLFSNTSTVGTVNGTKISKESFDQKLAMYGKQGQDRNTLIPQLWNYEVDNALMQQEYDKLGLIVSNKELADVLFGPQSPLAREKEFIDENGQFKADEARQAFAQLKKSKNNEQLQGVIESYIDPAIQQTLRTKYQNLLQQSAYVPTWLIEKQKADNSAIASISYVYVPYTTISDSSVKVSDAEIMAYVKKHPSGFEKDEESRTFSYVTFDAAPSAADTAAALNQVQSLKQEFATTSDVKSFLGKVGTELAYADAYSMKSQLKMPKADSIKGLADGQVFGPYLDGNNFVVAKMMGKRVLPDSVKVRHILVKTEDRRQSTLADSVAKKRIDSVEALAKSGVDFDQLVQKYSDDGGSKKTKGEYDFTSAQFSGISKEFAETIFYGKAGDKKVVKVENDAYAGYHYIEVISQKAVGEAVKVAYLAKPITTSNETVSTASTAALQFAANAKNRQQFEDNAKKLGKQVLLSQDIKEGDYTVPSLGQTPSRPIVRWLFENKLGTVSEPTELGDKYIVSIITAVNEKGLATVGEARAKGVESFVRNEKKAKQIIDSKFKGNTLEAYASSAGVTVQKADSLSYNNPSIPVIGYDTKVLGASFNKELQGKVSEPIAGNSGVVALKVESIGAKSIAMDDESIRQNILQTQRQAIGRGSNALRQAAVIKDYRFKLMY